MSSNRIIDEELNEKLIEDVRCRLEPYRQSDPVEAFMRNAVLCGFETSVTTVCESPIECLLLSELAFLKSPASDALPFNLIGNSRGNTCLSSQFLTITPQSQVGRYRIDFDVSFDPLEASCGGEFHVYIECDGHEYHERTKEQAARDRRKDRMFAAYHAPLLRFTGAEIVNDLNGCVEEIGRVLKYNYLRANKLYAEASKLRPEALDG
jgi:very-short-patch-repair endonuclease